MKQNQFSRRTNHIAREKLASILTNNISDPALEMIAITDVYVSVDKSLMIVYVSCDSAQYDEVMCAFERAKGRLRRLLGRALTWRTTPELVFRIDTTIDEAQAISRALTNVPPSMRAREDAAATTNAETAAAASGDFGDVAEATGSTAASDVNAR
jgi:hypothetical protein